MKTCTKCKIMKIDTEFSSTDYMCKECRSAYMVMYYKGLKHCSNCDTDKNREDFTYNGQKVRYCKECVFSLILNNSNKIKKIKCKQCAELQTEFDFQKKSKVCLQCEIKNTLNLNNDWIYWKITYPIDESEFDESIEYNYDPIDLLVEEAINYRGNPVSLGLVQDEPDLFTCKPIAGVYDLQVYGVDNVLDCKVDSTTPIVDDLKIQEVTNVVHSIYKENQEYKEEIEKLKTQIKNIEIQDFDEPNLYTMFSSFVGSKKMWIKELEQYRGQSFIEPFCGSAVLSLNLASECFLNDIDPLIVRIIERFNEQIVPECFTRDMYFEARGKEDWWKYVFCFQHMSFSGVFRYSKNGYNVPLKSDKDEIKVRDKYLLNLKKWQSLNLSITNECYYNLNLDYFKNKVVILDPPYQGSQACYNDSVFDYNIYWKWVDLIKEVGKTIIIFDRKSNLEKNNIPIYKVRSMRVNGKHDGDVEAMGIFENKSWLVK